MVRLVTLLVSLTLIGVAPSSMAQTAESEAIRGRMEQLMFEGELQIGGVSIITGEFITQLYAERDYQALWPSRDKISELDALAQAAYEEGLDPADYPLDALRRQRELPTPLSAPDAADLDILATETLLRIGYQIRFGKVNPAGLFGDWNFSRSLSNETERNRTIERIVAGDSLVDDVENLVQRGMLFRLLEQALARYREIAADGGWPTVAEGPALRAGDRDERVTDLRIRLRAEGDLPASAADDPLAFDATVADAVKRFQWRHGLDADGVVGKQTIEAMNVPVSYRIDQLRASLERGRWVMDEVEASGSSLVLVNIASAQAALFVNDKPVFVTRVQVGKPYRQTPVFKGDIQYLVVNPTWTLPPTILRNDVLPKLKADADAYLTEKHMDLLDRNGRKVDHTAVDWSTITASNFPYIVRQRPGPWNSLGQIKFIFPNPHFVFLHDTPSRAYFDLASRALSSGCIRVENPFALAELLMNDPQHWNQAAFGAILETQKEQVVHLPTSMPIFLMYWTGMADPDGTVRFYPDIYGRDAKLLNAIAQPPRIDTAIGKG